MKQHFDIFSQVDKKRLIIGTIIFFLFSLSFYAFMYMSRESMRLFSITSEYDLWVLTDDQVKFYNLIFAFFAAITALSMTITYWIDRPKKPFTKINYRRYSILNDQRFMTWSFLSWFSRVAFLFGFLYGDAFKGGFYVFSFYPQYIYLFIFFIIVIYLHLWMTLRLKLRNSLKWIFYTFIFISVYSFGLSKINFIDYKSFNNRYLEKNVFHKYDLNLPESNSYERLNQRSIVAKIFIVESLNQNTSDNYKIIIDNKIIPIDSLHIKAFLAAYNKNKNPFHFHYSQTTIQLYINKKIKMKHVNRIKNELAKSGITNIAYAVVPTNPIYESKYYQDCAIKMHLPPKDPVIPLPYETDY